MSGYPGAIPMFVDTSKVFIDANPSYAIVIHKTAGFNSIEELGAFFNTPGEWNTTHYGVGRDGRIAQFVDEANGAGGNCCVEVGYDSFWQPFVNSGTNLNLVTFSIEHLDPATDNSTPCTFEQIQASFALVKYLSDKYNIGPDKIKGHFSIDPISRARCPGNYPLNDLIAFVEGSLSMPLPKGWTDDGAKLHNPVNGNVVALGFRNYVLNANSWDTNNVPLMNEQHVASLEQSNPALGEGAIQIFRNTSMEAQYSNGNIFEGWIGQELLYVQAVQLTLLKTIADTAAQMKLALASLNTANKQILSLQTIVNAASAGTLQTDVKDMSHLLDELNTLMTPPKV